MLVWKSAGSVRSDESHALSLFSREMTKEKEGGGSVKVIFSAAI